MNKLRRSRLSNTILRTTTIQQQMPQKQQQPPVHVQQARFASFESPTLNQAESNNLNMLLDIPLQVTVELGGRNVR